MKEKFAHYNLELEEVLIGTPTAAENDKQIEIILNQLRSRQIADRADRDLCPPANRPPSRSASCAKPRPAPQKQTNITESELSINIQTNQGKAEYQRAVQQAAQIRTLAEAEAERIARTGIAQALATEEQVRAYGGPQFQVTQQVLNRFAEAIQAARVDVVPACSGQRREWRKTAAAPPTSWKAC